jgi:RNA polymerase sigma-70 factor (ECF subfamily)
LAITSKNSLRIIILVLKQSAKQVLMTVSQGKIRFNIFRNQPTQAAFTRFFDFYFTRLMHFSLTIVKTELLAEEVVMDVFTKLWEQQGQLDGIQNIETYLFVSVRNTALNAIKKERKFHFDMLEDSHVQLAVYKPRAESNLIEGEMLKALNQAVASLPAKCKMIFKLIREDGLNRNEVAEILAVSAKTVDNQVAIAVKKIADHLGIDLSNPSRSKGLTSFLLTL